MSFFGGRTSNTPSSSAALDAAVTELEMVSDLFNRFAF